MRPLAAIAIGLLLFTELIAAQDAAPKGPWRAERTRLGDTTVVRTLSGSSWGAIQLVEDLRIGTRDGDGPDSFGFITAFTVFPDGVMALFDQTVPALRLFSPDGKHLRTLGRDGAGPGEYRNQSLGLAVDRNGVLLMYDPRNARLNRWKEDGTVLPSWRAPGRLYTSQALQVDTTGATYIKVTTAPPEPGKEWLFGLLRLSSSGEAGDTIRQPAIAGPSTAGSSYFTPQKHWLLTRAGTSVTASGAEYSVTLVPSSGTPVRLQRSIKQVTLAAAERANYQAASDAVRRDPMVRSGPVNSVPDVKPLIRELQSDFDGRIWVRLHTKGEEYDPPPRPAQPGALAIPPIRWRERVVWDVFQPDGTYLGQLTLPWRTTLAAARGNQLWTVQRGEDDEQYIVRYRMVPAP